jgi:hypothetical protein
MYIRRDGKIELEGPYPSSYCLEIETFDILDQNDDGIYEFGEDLTLANIVVKNSGEGYSRYLSLILRGHAFAFEVARRR